jgi:excisionase family DNA binding protein
MSPESIASPGLLNGPPERQQFLTVQEIAGILKLNPQTVLKNWIGRGTLPAHQVGGRVRIRRADFEQLLETSRVQPRVTPRPSDDGGGRSSISSAL